MATSESLEQVFGQLLLPDNDAIQTATAQLKLLYNDAALVPSLCNVLSTSTSVQVRQYAAVMLRRKVGKKKSWEALGIEIRNGMKEEILKVLIQEQENVVRNSISQLIGTIAGHCLSRWAQLMHFIETYTCSENPYERQVSMLVLKTVSAEAPSQLQPHMSYLLNLCEKTLRDTENIMVPYYTIIILNNLTEEVSSSEMKQYAALIPHVLEVIKILATQNEEQAVEVMEIFDSLVDCEVAILSPHVKLIVSFCLQVGENENFGDALRVKALEIISWLVKMKKKAIMKQNLVQPICDIVFSIMCRGDDSEDDIEDTEETEKAASYASRIMDYLALHLPAERIVSIVMKRSEEALKSEKPCERKAGYVALGIIAEGCSDHISNKLIEPFLNCITAGFQDPHPGVRNGAMFSMGQFSEFLQPAIVKYSKQIVPLLLNYVNEVMGSTRNMSTLTRSYYALEAFVENLEKDVIPYLEPLMHHLLTILNSEDETELTIKLKELALSVISSIAVSAKENMTPYFGPVMQHLQLILSKIEGEKVQEVQLQAIATLSTLACEVGSEAFQPFVEQSLSFGLGLIERYNDPDLKKCVYRLFGSLASIQSEEMKPHLVKIIQLMIDTLKSTEGIKAYTSEEGEQLFQFLEDGAEESLDDDDDEDNPDNYSIENAYLDEKEEACISLGDIAIAYSGEFMPFVETAYSEVQIVMGYDSHDLMKTGLNSMADFARCIHKACLASPESIELQAGLKTMLQELVPKYIDTVKTDSDRDVAMEALHSMEDLLSIVGAPVVMAHEDFAHDIMACIKDVFKLKIACQDEDEDELDEDEQAEQDALLIENAGNILPELAKVMGGDVFQAYLLEFIPEFEKKAKASATVAERSFAVGILSECLMAMGGNYATAYGRRLFPLYERMMRDLDEEVRSNAVFGMGALLAHSANTLSDTYEKILSQMYDMLKKETSDNVRDNICAAVCRVATVGLASLPIRELYPIILECLPLKEDMVENATVYNFIVDTMFNAARAQIVDNLPKLMEVLCVVLPTEDVKTETKHKLLAMMKNLQQTEPESFTTAMACLSEKGHTWNMEGY